MQSTIEKKQKLTFSKTKLDKSNLVEEFVEKNKIERVNANQINRENETFIGVENLSEIDLTDEKVIGATIAPPESPSETEIETPLKTDSDDDTKTPLKPPFDPPLSPPSKSKPVPQPELPKLKKPAILLDIEANANQNLKEKKADLVTEDPPVELQEENASFRNPNKKAFATGRRKSSVARVSLRDGKGWIKINQKPASVYFQNNKFLLDKVYAPLTFLQLEKKVRISIIVQGGGLMGQADAIKLGICRALCSYDHDYRHPLKLKNYLTRDSRVKERKKYGLKKARKAPQYSKR